MNNIGLSPNMSALIDAKYPPIIAPMKNAMLFKIVKYAVNVAILSGFTASYMKSDEHKSNPAQTNPENDSTTRRYNKINEGLLFITNGDNNHNKGTKGIKREVIFMTFRFPYMSENLPHAGITSSLTTCEIIITAVKYK